MANQDPDRGKRLAQIVDQLRRANPKLSERQAGLGAIARAMAEELMQQGVKPEDLQRLQEPFSPAIPLIARDVIHRAEMDQAHATMTGKAIADALRGTAPVETKPPKQSRNRLGDLTPIGQRAIFFYLERHPEFKPRGFSDARRIKEFAVKHGLPGAERLNPEAAFGKLVQAAAEGRVFAPVASQKKKA
jgi:hypothetical protein